MFYELVAKEWCTLCWLTSLSAWFYCRRTCVPYKPEMLCSVVFEFKATLKPMKPSWVFLMIENEITHRNHVSNYLKCNGLFLNWLFSFNISNLWCGLYRQDSGMTKLLLYFLEIVSLPLFVPSFLSLQTRHSSTSHLWLKSQASKRNRKIWPQCINMCHVHLKNIHPVSLLTLRSAVQSTNKIQFHTE